jgi:hypothetical protein
MANKRKYRRFIRRCETEFSSGGESYRGISSDFSVAGMFIRTQNPLPPDTVLDITVTLPDGAMSKLSGLVRRAYKTSASRYASAGGTIQKSGMGVELTEKDANYLDFLRSFLLDKDQAGDAEYKTAVRKNRSPEEPEAAQEDAIKEEAPERASITMNEMLIHLITTQQALINLLDRQGVIDKRKIAEEMKKLRKK